MPTTPSGVHAMKQSITILLLGLLVLAGAGVCRAADAFNLPVAPWMTAHGTDKYGAWSEFTIGVVTQRLRWIKPGTFIMGSPESEPGHFDCEQQHKVTLTQGFWLADSDVTQGQWWWTVVKDGQWRRSFPVIDTNKLTEYTLPVVRVSFNECQLFLKVLNNKVPGLNACLPTEAQWEYACRAGTTGPYAGDLKAMAWMYENASNTAHAVKTKAPNAWGLYDMHGNVYNWCQDAFTNYTAGALTDPVCTNGAGRVIRGGAYYYHAGYLRSASRWGLDPNNTDTPYIGFRICVPASEPR